MLDLDLWPWIFKVKLYLGMGGPIVMEQKVRELLGCPDVKHWGNESSGHCANWGTFDLDLWPWIFKIKLYPGNRRPDCHGTKGTGVDRMLWCETLRKWVKRTLRWLGVPLIFTFDLEFSRSHCIWGMGGRIVMKWKGRESMACMPWCKTQPLCDLDAEETVRDGVT